MQSRAVGESFENAIDASLIWYEQHGIASIKKTPEPMKPLSRPDRMGRFRACFEKKAQADFSGTLDGGQAIRFEAKHTDDDRIKYDRLSDEQVKDLETHTKLGAVTFVLVSFGMEGFFRIPWTVWRDMKKVYGRKYITRKEAERYRVPYMAGVIKILDGIYPDEKGAAYLKSGAYPDPCVACGAYAGEGAHVCPEHQVKGDTP